MVHMQKSGLYLVILLVIPFVAAQYMYTPNIGQTPTCTEGDTRCDGNAFQMCVNAQWQTTTQCEFGCSSQGCAQSPPNRPSENEQPPQNTQPPPAITRPQICSGGEKRCSGQTFQLCLHNDWQTQQTCGKTQECTKRGCVSKSVVAAPIPMLPPELPAKTPLPIELVKLPLLRQPAIALMPPETKPLLPPEKPKSLIDGIIHFFKSFFGKEPTCSEECDESYDDCVKWANERLSIVDRMKAQYWCTDAHITCLDDCKEKERELGGLKELPPTQIAQEPMPKVEKSKEKIPAGISKRIVVPSTGGESELIPSCRGLCAKSHDECIKDSNKWFSIVDRMKAQYWCNQANTACLDNCKKEETEIKQEQKPSVKVPGAEEKPAIVPPTEKPPGVTEPVSVPPKKPVVPSSGSESELIPSCLGLCAKSHDECIKDSNKWLSIVDRMKAQYWCNQANTACLDNCKKEETKLPPEVVTSHP